MADEPPFIYWFCDQCYDKVTAVGRVPPDQMGHRDPDTQQCMNCGLLPRSANDN